MLTSVHVSIDATRCLGHGRCLAACPELFDIDDSGAGFVIRSDVPHDLLGRARQAELNCPERAITLTERPHSDQTKLQPTETHPTKTLENGEQP
jgi:ferredoxin